MSVPNYNSYPASAEVMLRRDGSLALMRKRQTPEQVYENEVDIDL